MASSPAPALHRAPRTAPGTDGAGISALEGTAFTAWPNPFASTVNIAFTTASDGPVTIEVFDLSGKSVGVPFSGSVKAGELQTVQFDGSALPQGIASLAMLGEVVHSYC